MRFVVAFLLVAGCATQQPETAPPQRDLAAEARTLAVGTSTKDDVLAALGEGEVIEFDSGYEVWIYREPPPAKHTELVLLFDPSGTLTRTRVR